jgi:8-oxo-dGTP pyrophosphatase MutT (NUDIX family)
MNSPDWIVKLKEELQKPLPGWDAQKEMSPPARKSIDDYKALINQQTKKSAVSLILTEQNNEKQFVLIKKTGNSGRHSGQFGLPGGKVENTDSTLWHTAVRETEEEVGIKLTENNLLGNLSEMFIPPTNYLVYPYISYLNKIKEIKLQQEEIEEIYFIPIEQLLDDKIVIEMEFYSSYSNTVICPCYNFNGLNVWGATAMMLSEFKSVLRNVF